MFTGGRVAVATVVAGTAMGLLTGTASAVPEQPYVRTVAGPTAVHSGMYADVRTRVQVVVTEHRTAIVLQASGFPAAARGRTFGAHVHRDACGPAAEDSGPHHQNPDAPPGTPPHHKEAWLDLRVGPSGEAHAIAVVPWAIKAADAGSVVIHAAPTDHATGDAGDRLLCTTVPFAPHPN